MFLWNTGIGITSSRNSVHIQGLLIVATTSLPCIFLSPTNRPPYTTQDMVNRSYKSNVVLDAASPTYVLVWPVLYYIRSGGSGGYRTLVFEVFNVSSTFVKFIYQTLVFVSTTVFKDSSLFFSMNSISFLARSFLSTIMSKAKL